MPKSENQYTKFIIILNYTEEVLSKADAIAYFLCEHLNRDFCARYAYIHHDKDLKETGEYKTYHTHIVIWKNLRVRKSTLLKYISQQTQLPIECISVQPCTNVSAMIRYLIHQDCPDKYRYQKIDIETNSDAEVKDALEYIGDDISSDTLEVIINNCNGDKKLVAQELGPTKYCRWRFYIELFCK